MAEARGRSLGEIASLLGVECAGDPDILIQGLAPLNTAGASQLSFLANPKYRKQLSETDAAAVIVHPDMGVDCPVPCLLSDDPYLSFARATVLFNRAPAVSAGVHPSAVVHDTAQLAEGVAIAANVVIGEGVVIGKNTQIGAGSVIAEGCRLGEGCCLHANVTLYHDIVIADRVTLHAGVVVGADGFGFAPSSEGWVKIHQLGSVRIGSDVEVGANTTIDRGALDDTVIGDRVILDNQVQVAHNVVIGEGTAMAGCAAVAGSTTIGRNCTIAGGVGIVGHIHIADGTHVTARTLVTKSIDEKGAYSSGTPMMESADWRKSAVRFTQLDAMQKRLKALEQALKNKS